MRPIAACANGSGRTHTRWSGHTGITRHSPRNGLRLIARSPWRPGFLATIARAPERELDASVGASGPHVFAVRLRRFRQKRHQRPPHPRPALMTLRNAPLRWDGMARVVEVICPTPKAEYFCER